MFIANFYTTCFSISDPPEEKRTVQVEVYNFGTQESRACQTKLIVKAAVMDIGI